MLVDVKLLTLLCVLKEGSYTAAAEALSLSQPAVSYHIHQLEQEFHIKIFYRNPKKLTLTPEGKVLVKYFTVGLTPTCGEALVGRVFTAYCNAHPHTSISLVTDSLDKLCDKLSSYALDFAIVEGTVSLKHCHTELMDMDYLCVVMSPEHRLAGHSSITLDELKKESLILRREEAGTRRLFESVLTGHLESIRNFDVRLEMDNIATIKELVAENLGVTIMAHSACREELAAGRLVAVRIEGIRMIREINILCRDDFDHPELLAEIKKIYAAL